MLRWWPAAYAVAWAMFAWWAVEPQLFGGGAWATRLLAGTGAVLLLWLAFEPRRPHLRIAATLVAIAFPLYRFFSLAWEPAPFLPTASRIVGMTAWALLAINLMIFYPITWFEGQRQGRDHGRS